MLRDWRFRNALNYAIDRNGSCAIAFNGYATPGTTILPPNTWRSRLPLAADRRPGLHLRLGQGGAAAHRAGYPLKNGVRVDKQGKPITLRLWATTDNDPRQIEGKLITGWLQQLGFRSTSA